MSLGKLAEIQMGYPFRSRLEHDPQGDVAVIQMKDIDDTNLLHAKEASRVVLPRGKTHHLLRTGDLLFRSRGRSNGAAQVLDGIGMAVLAAPMLLIRPHGVLPDASVSVLPNAPATQERAGWRWPRARRYSMIGAEALKALDVPLPPPGRLNGVPPQVAALAEQTLLERITTLRQRLTTHILMKFVHEATP